MLLRNGLEPWHLVVVTLVAMLVFGSKRLPDAARSLGTSLRILKSEARALKQESAPHPPREPGGSEPPAA
ncbi:Sec-independent protein translocase subunit TatA [Streptomyces qinglanensis]|uniref:Sec-independent protein translocase subunit TatA n=1 Tax=Streptomyces qinglanensis TaxID=943816 RepID=UPI003D720B2D